MKLTRTSELLQTAFASDFSAATFMMTIRDPPVADGAVNIRMAVLMKDLPNTKKKSRSVDPVLLKYFQPRFTLRWNSSPQLG